MSINSEQYFSTVPNINCPRSYFDRSFSHKFTMNCDYLYPFFIDEALPGDSFKVNFQVFGRLENPLIRSVMDELYFETLWFKIPNRLVWSHWVNFCGEQDNPDDSTDYLLPTVNVGQSGVGETPWTVQGIFDIFGIPSIPNNSTSGATVYKNSINSLPLRAYNLVWNQWFRDENLQDSVTVPMGDDDSASNYTLLKSNKSHDYFTSCLPFAQKGEPVQIPFMINGSGITSNGQFTLANLYTPTGETSQSVFQQPLIANTAYRPTNATSSSTAGNMAISGKSVADIPLDAGFPSGQNMPLYYHSGLSVDTGAFQGINVNDFRFAMALQTKRERDARGGTRYIEWIKSQFDVDSPDARLQRTEFLGSTKNMIDINSVIQTSSTDSTSPQGNISAYGILNSFNSVVSTSFVEHSYLLGLCRIRHNPVYQQGISRLWKRKELLDFYIPAFVGLGEQPVFNYEIYNQGDDVVDENNVPVDEKTFGFQPAWSDYRYSLNRVSGYLRSNVTNSLDIYHFAEQFSQLPLLNSSFIQSNVPIASRLALPTDVEGNDFPQFVMDVRFIVECARPMPVVDIPAGLHNHF